jgi:hypothetical protein
LGNPVAGAVVHISLASGNGLLIGTLTATTDARGKAVFKNLILILVGSGRLRISASGVRATSSSFSLAIEWKIFDNLP